MMNGHLQMRGWENTISKHFLVSQVRWWSSALFFNYNYCKCCLLWNQTLGFPYDCSCLNVQRNSNQWYKFVEKENKEMIQTCLFCLVSDVSSHCVCYYCIFFRIWGDHKLFSRVVYLRGWHSRVWPFKWKLFPMLKKVLHFLSLWMNPQCLTIHNESYWAVPSVHIVLFFFLMSCRVVLRF